MSPKNATSSPRDDNVDANPDLARKKQRLSEDHDNDDSTAEDTVLIEACEPEDIGASLNTAIEIEEDDDNIMLPYSDTFSVRPQEQPLQQIAQVHKDIASGRFYLQVDIFTKLADWIIEHLDDTKGETAAQWQRQYLELDSEFFSRLGNLAFTMLRINDLFEPADVTKPGMKEATPKFFVGISELSSRIISLLPDVISSMLSRRDSAAQGSALAQPVELFWYLGVAVRSLPGCSKMAQSVRRLNIDMAAIHSMNMTTLSKPEVIEALGTIVKLLSGAMRQIKDSWMMLLEVMKLFGMIIGERRYDVFPNSVFEGIMEVLKACILPAICAKHPGALPDDFHREFIRTGRGYLFHFVQDHSHGEALQLYSRFIKSDEESIVPEGVADEDISETLADISGNDARVLGQLFATSWQMQASIAYVRSDIMNVRNIGLAELTAQLQDAYDYAKKHCDLDNIYIQHAVRFLRKNEVTKYIFSSDSHASLISESTVIVSFLSSTATYTDQETDVIWRACSTSVEADFVKASFGVLDHQLHNLDFGHVLYILKKYASTPIEGLGAAAAEFLPDVIRRLEGFQGPTLLQASRLALAFSLIDVLKHIDASKAGASTVQLRHILHIAIANFAGHGYTQDDRREIYARILPDIGQHSSAGTTAAEILTILLQQRSAQEDAEVILAMLPVTAAVDDLRVFVTGNREGPVSSSTINSVIIRLSYILRLMSLDTEAPSDAIVKKLFDSIFGAEALGEAARAAAWDKLSALTTDGAPSAAFDLWRNYMQHHVPSLPTALANPRLVDLIHAYIRAECETGEIASNYALVLRHPLWKALVRFVTTSSDLQVITSASAAITHLLFNYPAHPSTPDLRDVAVECQQESVRSLVRTLQNEFGQLLEEPTTTSEQIVLQTIDLLHSILKHSKAFAASFTPAIKHDVIVLESSDVEADRLSFTLQIYNVAPQPQVFSVQATKRTTVSQLLASLPAKTGASANRVIAGGREITNLTTQSLDEAGVQSPGVMQIRPRYKQDFNFDHLLMNAGPVEQEIVAHFDPLEVLVDGPSVVAERAVDFLEAIPPSSKARDQVASPSTLPAHLFPKDRPARARFSIHVLKWHLGDCARIGVADIQFLARGVHVLTSVLMDATRDLLEPISAKLLACLHAFLQERPTSDDSQAYFDDGAAFAGRMMDRLFEIERSAQSSTAGMTALASDAYSTLLLASQIDGSVWHYLCTSDRAAMLHVQLLLHPNASFSEGIARPIRSLCRNDETPKTVSDTFWETLLACLPEALRAPQRSLVFFTLATDVLQATEKVRASETNARSLVELLTVTLWSYNHAESANYLNRDDAMLGLLTLLRDAVIILKSFKKPLELAGLSSRVAEQLLFPNDLDPKSRPIINDSTRTMAYDLLRLTLESAADFERIVDATEQITERSVRRLCSKFPGAMDWWRSSTQCSGLHNLGMTCYMNSMLQQLFGNIQFRRFIMDLPVEDPQRHGLLHQIQSLFAKMQSDMEPAHNTQDLAQALGIQIGNQEDVHDFYASLLSRLEDEMPDIDSRAALSRFFTGQSITQIRGECGHVSSQKEAFGDLSVTVKNKPNLHESLAEFVQGEPMEGSNKYKCMSCDPQNGRLVDAVRRTCLEDVPDCLTVCLKRFTFGSKFLGEGKVNDRFDFPETIDMSVYKRTHLEAPEQAHEPDDFQLVGVIVHQGSLNLGHYWSYVRVPNQLSPGDGDWFYLEDTKTMFCPNGFDHIRQECFGGQRYTNGNERPDNAYVLCYQRKKYMLEAPLVCEGAGSAPSIPVSLPRVPLREPLAGEINTHNAWRQRITALFDPKFANHVCWLFNQYPGFRETRAGISDSESILSTSELSEEALQISHDAKLGALMTKYVIRILLSDPTYENKTSQTISALQTALAACPNLAHHVLGTFTLDSFGLETTLLNDHSKARMAVFELLKSCISVLREHDQPRYIQEIDRLLGLHAGLLDDFVDRYPRLWGDYLALPAFVARQGSLETWKVLEKGYFNWIVEITWMLVPSQDKWKRKHQRLADTLHRDSFVDFDPLYHFLYELLSEHVDLIHLEQPVGDNDQRAETPYGWSLKDLECKALMLFDTRGRHQLWTLFMLAQPRCRLAQKHWQDYGFGKLLGLLVSDKATPSLRNVVFDTLAWQYDKDDSELTPLLWATLHYCANADDGDCKELLRLLGRNLPLWNVRKPAIWFLHEAFAFAPCSILESVEKWGVPFLCEKGPGTRHATAAWLSAYVFVDRPLSDDSGLDARRVSVARSLAVPLSNLVKTAYNEEKAKNAWEAAMDVLQAIATYFSKLFDAVAQAKQDEVDFLGEVLIESNEARTLLPRLNALLQELADWESSEFALPTRGATIRQSVEIDDSDDNVSDEDEELLDDIDDDFSQSM